MYLNINLRDASCGTLIIMSLPKLTELEFRGKFYIPYEVKNPECPANKQLRTNILVTGILRHL